MINLKVLFQLSLLLHNLFIDQVQHHKLRISMGLLVKEMLLLRNKDHKDDPINYQNVISNID